jgi:hypothetical protein
MSVGSVSTCFFNAVDLCGWYMFTPDWQINFCMSTSFGLFFGPHFTVFDDSFLQY